MVLVCVRTFLMHSVEGTRYAAWIKSNCSTLQHGQMCMTGGVQGTEVLQLVQYSPKTLLSFVHTVTMAKLAMFISDNNLVSSGPHDPAATHTNQQLRTSRHHAHLLFWLHQADTAIYVNK